MPLCEAGKIEKHKPPKSLKKSSGEMMFQKCWFYDSMVGFQYFSMLGVFWWCDAIDSKESLLSEKAFG